MKRTTILRAIFLCTLLCAPPASASLIAAWHFDEPAGVIATPAVGLVTGALQGSATFAPGQGIAGGAVRLTTGAANSLVNFGNNFSFPGTSNFSILAWIKTDTSDTAFLLPVGKHNGGSANGYFLIVNDTSDGTAANRARFFVTGVNTAQSAIVVHDGQWHQLVGTYRDAGAGTNSQSLYVDGVLQSSFTLFNPVTANTAPFIAGGYNNAGTPINAYAGLIDEIRVFDNALTPADVQSLFTNPAAVPEPAAALLIALPLACLLRRKK